MMPIDADMGDVPPPWNFHIAVDDCDATGGKMREVRGSTLVAPADIPGIGHFVVLSNPRSASFSVIALENHEE